MICRVIDHLGLQVSDVERRRCGVPACVFAPIGLREVMRFPRPAVGMACRVPKAGRGASPAVSGCGLVLVALTVRTELAERLHRMSSASAVSG
jgi:hypothetical protein